MDPRYICYDDERMLDIRMMELRSRIDHRRHAHERFAQMSMTCE
jgi:hypothetical protein